MLTPRTLNGPEYFEVRHPVLLKLPGVLHILSPGVLHNVLSSGVLHSVLSPGRATFGLVFKYVLIDSLYA